MQKTDLKEPLAAALLVKNALKSLNEQLQTICDEENRLIAQKKSLKSQAVPIEDVKQALLEYVDARAQLFLSDGLWKTNLRRFVYPKKDHYALGSYGKAMSYDDAENLRDGAQGDTVFASDHPKLVIPNVGMAETTDIPFLFFFGDAVKAKIAACFDAGEMFHDTSEEIGLPIVERKKIISEIDERLAEIRAERASLEQQISELRN